LPEFAAMTVAGHTHNPILWSHKLHCPNKAENYCYHSSQKRPVLPTSMACNEIVAKFFYFLKVIDKLRVANTILSAVMVVDVLVLLSKRCNGFVSSILMLYTK
jgi:hypothetical protein